MALFTDQMESLTNELLTARKERGAFVVDVQQRANKVLADARTFVTVLGQEHGVMAERLRKDLATNGQERLGAVKAQRQQNREQLQSMRKGLQEVLAQTRRQRQECVAALRTECRTAQKDLASDLRQAGQVWKRTFEACTTNGSHKGNVKVTAGATVTEAGPPVKTEAAAHPKDHGHAAEAKPAAHGNQHGKAAETAHPKEHGHGHAAEAKHTHTATHGGHHGKGHGTHHSH